MMSDMSAVTKSARARAGATPEFVALCKTLYGDLIDPDEVWADVIKAGPDQADVNAHSAGRRVLEGTALASTVAGGILGIKEGAGAVRSIRAARAAGRAVPASAYRSAGLAGAATGGDAITTGVLASQNKKKKRGQLQPVDKGLNLKPVNEVASGLRRTWGGMTEQMAAGERHVLGVGQPKPATALDPNAADRATTIGRGLGAALGTKSGKVVAGGGVVAAGSKAGKARRKAKGEQYEYAPDPYAFGKSDEVVWKGTFSKLDDDKRLAFGWASVVELGGQPVVDRQGDYISPEDIEEAAYGYVHKSRVGGDMHRRNGEAPHKVSDLVESMVFTDDKVAKMGLPDDFPRGWWVGFKIHDEDTWGEVKKGGRTGFSIHGKGIRKDHNLDELMGY